MIDILVVDDEQAWRDLFTELLENAGYTVRTVENGVLALDEIKRRKPDLTILDIRMSPSGRDLLRSVRRLMPEMPVVVCSSYGGYRDDPDFSKVDAYVVKSTDMEELLRAIDKTLVKRQLHGRNENLKGRASPSCPVEDS
jgi:DNA-binding NtrC family response regulator